MVRARGKNRQCRLPPTVVPGWENLALVSFNLGFQGEVSFKIMGISMSPSCRRRYLTGEQGAGRAGCPCITQIGRRGGGGRSSHPTRGGVPLRLQSPGSKGVGTPAELSPRVAEATFSGRVRKAGGKTDTGASRGGPPPSSAASFSPRRPWRGGQST